MIVLGLPYDIGFGQKLFLRCRGRGAPTGIYVRKHLENIRFSSIVILDAPTGMNSDIWLPLQENLKQMTTVNH